jgi:type IV pilus assembly protein PilA
MLLNRLIQLFSRKICRIYNCDNWQIGLKFTEQECSRKHPRKQIFCNSTFCLLPFAFFLGVTPITLPVFFAATKVQRPPTLKAQESAAKQYVAAMNKAQQAYHANNTGFTSSVSNLGLGIKPDTSNYKYSINMENKAVFNYAVSNQAHLKSFVGGVFLVGNKTQTILCLNVAPGKIKPANPMNANGVIQCAAGTGKIAQ